MARTPSAAAKHGSGSHSRPPHSHSHTHYTRSSSAATKKSAASPPRREIIAYIAPTGGSDDGSGGDAIVFALAIALGVAMVVVIILICIYASRRNNNDNDDTDCQGSRDTRYIDIDVLAQKSTTALASVQQPEAVLPKENSAVVLTGPLKAQNPALTVPKNEIHAMKPAVQPLAVAPNALTHTSAAAIVSKKPPTVIEADAVKALVESSDVSAIFVVSKSCGACIKLQQMLSGLDDASKIQLLHVQELSKLPADLKAQLASQYIPTLFKVGNGTIEKDAVGVPSQETLQSLAAV